jgi:hypothetical protein
MTDTLSSFKEPDKLLRNSPSGAGRAETLRKVSDKVADACKPQENIPYALLTSVDRMGDSPFLNWFGKSAVDAYLAGSTVGHGHRKGIVTVTPSPTPRAWVVTC